LLVDRQLYDMHRGKPQNTAAMMGGKSDTWGIQMLNTVVMPASPFSCLLQLWNRNTDPLFPRLHVSVYFLMLTKARFQSPTMNEETLAVAHAL
jgi:hypothetical protein